MRNKGEELYIINRDVICLNCNHKGAIQSYGKWYDHGMGEYAKTLSEPYNKYVDQPFMSHAMGFGGTIPYVCTNCGNVGLIDFGGLEGYKQAFKSIEKIEEN